MYKQTVILQYCWWQHFSLCVCGLGEGEGDWSHFLHVVDLTPVHASRTIRLWDMYSKCQPSWLDALQPRIDLTQGSITLDTVNMCYILGNGNTFLRTLCFWSCVFCCQSEYYDPQECFDTLLWFWKFDCMLAINCPEMNMSRIKITVYSFTAPPLSTYFCQT